MLVVFVCFGEVPSLDEMPSYVFGYGADEAVCTRERGKVNETVEHTKAAKHWKRLRTKVK